MNFNESSKLSVADTDSRHNPGGKFEPLPAGSPFEIVIPYVLWLLAFVSSYTMGGFIHILLVLAIIAVFVQLFQVCHRH